MFKKENKPQTEVETNGDKGNTDTNGAEETTDNTDTTEASGDAGGTDAWLLKLHQLLMPDIWKHLKEMFSRNMQIFGLYKRVLCTGQDADP